MTAIRVVLAEDQPMVRAGFRALLDATSDIEVVGEAATGSGALEEVRALRPDVVVMDIHMPRLDGIEATRLIRAQLRRTRVVVVTSSGSIGHRAEALAAGAAAFLHKDAPLDELIATVAGTPAGSSAPVRLQLRQASC